MMNIYQYMNSLEIEELGDGIDALTITAMGLDGKLSVDLVKYCLRDYIEAQEPKPFKFQGAEGTVWGSVRYAARWNELKQRHWAILMVTGERSKQALVESLKFSDIKYTRVDLYIDVKMRERVLSLPRKLKDTYKGGHKIKLIESLTGDTLYVGSRESESMLRLYDKSPEYGLELGYVWRWEVEYKGQLAGLVANSIQREGNKFIQDAVWCDARDKDLPTPVIPEKVNLMGRSVTISSSEMKLNWLNRQVRPTVEFLVKMGYKEEVSRALQLRLI